MIRLGFALFVIVGQAPSTEPPTDPIHAVDVPGGAETTTEVAPAVPAEQVVAGFVRHVSDSAAYEPSARDFVRKSHLTVTPERLGRFINESLAVLSPRFKQGLDLVDGDDAAKAADVFEELARSDDPYLSVAAANFAATALIELDQIDRCAAVLRAVEQAHAPVDRYTTNHDNYLFQLGYCQVHGLDYDAARKTLDQFVRRYPNAPERLRVTATQILTELSRRVPGGIGDVRDLLGYARRRIGHGETGEPVIERQREAVALLDALIEEAEEREKGQCSGGEGGEGDGKGGGSPGGAGQPGGGATRSTLPQGGDREAQLNRGRARPGEAWGRMPPKQRDEVLQSLGKQFPSQYRELLEQYYSQLAKDAPQP